MRGDELPSDAESEDEDKGLRDEDIDELGQIDLTSDLKPGEELVTVRRGWRFHLRIDFDVSTLSLLLRRNPTLLRVWVMEPVAKQKKARIRRSEGNVVIAARAGRGMKTHVRCHRSDVLSVVLVFVHRRDDRRRRDRSDRTDDRRRRGDGRDRDDRDKRDRERDRSHRDRKDRHRHQRTERKEESSLVDTHEEVSEPAVVERFFLKLAFFFL